MATHTIDTEALFFTSLVTPEAIERVNSTSMPSIAAVAIEIATNPRARVWFLGGGASLAAMMGGSYLLERYSRVPATVCTGWQFLSRVPEAVDENAFIVLTSYSGETPEIVEAKQLARTRGARTIAITNSSSSPLAADADAVFDFQSKAVFTAPLAIVYALAAHVINGQDERADCGASILEELQALPAAMARQAERTRELAQQLAAKAIDSDVFYVIGSGPNYGLAYKLALSVVIENLWKDAAPVDAGEFYHGPIEIISPRNAAQERRAFLHLVGTDRSRAVSERVVAFCEQKGARNLVFDAADYSEFGELFAPFALFVPTEWWVMEMAAQKGHDVDQRRYMGKLGARWGEYA